MMIFPSASLHDKFYFDDKYLNNSLIHLFLYLFSDVEGCP